MSSMVALAPSIRILRPASYLQRDAGGMQQLAGQVWGARASEQEHSRSCCNPCIAIGQQQQQQQAPMVA